MKHLMATFARACPVIGLLVTAASAQVPGWPIESDLPDHKPEKVTAETLTRIRLATDVEPVGVEETFHLAVVFDLEPGWHIYWKNPGEGALPPSITIRQPAGFEVLPPRWTRPTRFSSEIGDEYGYRKQAVIFVPIKTPATLEAGEVTFEADIHWAVCREACYIGHVKRTITVKTSPRRLKRGPRSADPVLTRHFARLPRHLRDARQWGESFAAGELFLSGPAHGLRTAIFFPDATPGITYGEPTILFWEERFSVTVDVEVNPTNTLGLPMSLGGVVALGDGSDDPSYDFRIPIRDQFPPEEADDVGRSPTPGAGP